MFTGSDGSMLLRNLVSREQLLPPTVVEDTWIHSQTDVETEMPREAYYEEVHLACLQLPRPREHSLRTEKGNIYSAIEKKIAEVHSSNLIQFITRYLRCNNISVIYNRSISLVSKEPVVSKSVGGPPQVVPLRLRNRRWLSSRVVGPPERRSKAKCSYPEEDQKTQKLHSPSHVKVTVNMIWLVWNTIYVSFYRAVELSKSILN